MTLPHYVTLFSTSLKKKWGKNLGPRKINQVPKEINQDLCMMTKDK